MNYYKRYIADQVKKDVEKKMVFLGGPREVGKTTIALNLLDNNKNGYLNWDIPADREIIIQRNLPDSAILVFDEIHKYKLWQNYLKAIYDQFFDTKKILITASSKLDPYRMSGDSLQGRYHYLRLYPLTIAELGITKL